MNKEKTRKIVLISIIAAGLLLFVAIIAVAISFFMDKNNKPSKETTQLEPRCEQDAETQWLSAALCGKKDMSSRSPVSYGHSLPLLWVQWYLRSP